MVKAPTDAPKDTASPHDVLLNLSAFVPHLRAANRSPNTIRSYVEAVEKLDAFLESHGMPRLVANIRREHVEAFINDQLARLRPASAANRYRSVQQFFRWLVDEGEIKESPMARMSPPTLPQQPPPILCEDDINALRKAASGTSFDDRRDRAIIELLYSSGIRRAELVGLGLEDIDRDLQVARVKGKDNKWRAAPYDDVAAKALNRYVLRARPTHHDAKLPWLWLGKRGRLTESGVAQILNRRGTEAGVGHINPHRFRHTAAHELMAGGMQEGDLMRIFGWSSPQMPKRYGASAADERAVASYRAIKERAR
jgi:site-specific recombinase XerD